MSMEIIGPQANRVQADTVRLLQPCLGMTDEETAELASKIMVVIPHRPGEGINARLAQNIGYWSRLSMPVAIVGDQFGGFIEFTRAGIARQFLEYCNDRPNVEFCIMIDNDEYVDWDAPLRLAHWGKDIVSGVVCSYSDRKGGVFACFTIKDEYGIARFPSTKFTKKMPSKGLVEAHTAGTGLLCVHKNVFKKMIEAEDYPFLIPEEVRLHCAATGTLKLGEDMAFAVAAKRHGYNIYVDLSVHAIHYKFMEIAWPKQARLDELDSRSWQVSDEDYVHQ